MDKRQFWEDVATNAGPDVTYEQPAAGIIVINSVAINIDDPYPKKEKTGIWKGYITASNEMWKVGYHPEKQKAMAIPHMGLDNALRQASKKAASLGLDAIQQGGKFVGWLRDALRDP